MRREKDGGILTEKFRHLEVAHTVDWKLEKQDLSKEEIENGALTERRQKVSIYLV